MDFDPGEALTQDSWGVRSWLGIAVTGLCALPLPVRAQIDYRNLEDDRPALIEDAYPIERHAFEFLAPWRYGRDRHGGSAHAFSPELEYGVTRNGQLGFKLPVAGTRAGESREWGVAGLKVFGLYNFNTEGGVLPALAIRTDVTFPVGRLAGEGTRVTVKGIATRSFGLHRLHVNGAYTFGKDRPLGAAEPAHKWWAGVAADRTFFRRSTLFIAEVYALRDATTEPVQINASIGLRRQVDPYTVFDVGVARRLRVDAGPDYELTIGLSRAFAIAGLMGLGR
ncbi:MAG TPA: hypothetical protein VI383_11980 [Gemmatimonadales bacterium]|nr:hypothetical protein [Gemmatimonadales bacterium]